MMEGWEEVRIKDLGQVVTGNTPPRKQPELYGKHTLFVKPTDINIGEKYCYEPEECYSEKGFNKYKKSLIPKNATCVVTIGSIGKKMIKSHTDLFINQAMNAIIPNDNYDDDFIFYLLKLNLFQLKTFDSGTASGRENVSKSSFSNIKISVPKSKETQRKIASILSAYDDLIENNLKRIKLLEEQAQKTYEEWFVRFKFPSYKDVEFDEVNGLPVGWKEGKLSDLINFQSGFAYKSAQFKDEGFSVIKIKNIGNNTIDTENTNFINEEYASKTEKFKLNSGDLLIAMTGATVGKVGVVPITKKPCYLNQRVGRFISFEEVDNSAFINCFFNIGNGLHHVMNIAGGAAQPNISASQILSIETIVPKLEVLREFSKYAISALKAILNLQNQNQHLKEARDILLPRLMSGVIDVDDLQVNGRLGMVAQKNETYYKVKTETKASQQFKDAVLLSMHVNQYTTPKFTLSTYRFTKFSYLYRRFYDNKIADYKRKAAGPYNEKYKYKGPLAIALKNKYIKQSKGKYKGFEKGENINEALSYAPNYWDFEVFKLVDKFRYKKDKELETITTIDHAILNLKEKGSLINLETIKQDIREDDDWKHKLEQDNFSDENIIKAKNDLEKLFNY